MSESLAEPMTRFELVASSLPRKRSTPELHRPILCFRNWAGDEIRTRDPQLGRLTLYQLSYSRLKILFKLVGVDGLEPTIPLGDRFTVCCNSHYATPPKSWSRWRDSNPRPADYKSAALASWATPALKIVFYYDFKERFLKCFPVWVCKCSKEINNCKRLNEKKLKKNKRLKEPLI